MSGSRPQSDVGLATGFVGCIGFVVTLFLISSFQIPASAAVLALLTSVAAPMIAWEFLVRKSHRRPSAGLDFSLRRSPSETLVLTLTKTLGLAATMVFIFVFYSVFEYYREARFDNYFIYISLFFKMFLVAAPIYIWITTKYMIEPKDGYWHLGRLIMFKTADADIEIVRDHLRSWVIKAFFMAFMFSIMPGAINYIAKFDFSVVDAQPHIAFIFLIQLLFLFDVTFGTIGYVLTLRVLDSHIRSANPYLSGWIAAFICYPPFIVMTTSGPLNYRSGGQEWLAWFEGQPLLLLAWGAVLTILTLIYAWSTVIFGIRFSNLTHRGIITNGPYSVFKHPAYLSKCAFWWLVFLPFLSMDGWRTAFWNTLMLSVVCAIYYWRAKTEERHLMVDPVYQRYSAWIDEHGLIPKLRRAVAKVVRKKEQASTGSEGHR